ncbi:hypothetical protein GCM10009638_19430 [Luteococcus sanguinis]
MDREAEQVHVTSMESVPVADNEGSACLSQRVNSSPRGPTRQAVVLVGFVGGPDYGGDSFGTIEEWLGN